MVSFPHETTPLISARIATSFGCLASNKSATLGSPPVMSLVLEDSLGILARTSPISIGWPSVTFTRDFCSNLYSAGLLPPGSITSFPLASVMTTIGFISFPAEVLSDASKISTLDKPVNSSVTSLMVMPFSISLRFTLPLTSEIIGWFNGSQVANNSPDLIAAPSLTFISAP